MYMDNNRSELIERKGPRRPGFQNSRNYQPRSRGRNYDVRDDFRDGNDGFKDPRRRGR